MKSVLITAWLICIGFVALTLFVSYLSYRFLEVPARRWINPKTTDKVKNTEGVYLATH